MRVLSDSLLLSQDIWSISYQAPHLHFQQSVDIVDDLYFDGHDYVLHDGICQSCRNIVSDLDVIDHDLDVTHLRLTLI